MNNIFKIVFLGLIFLQLTSCKKDEEDEVTPPREYSVQLPIDKAAIDEYLATHYLDSNNEIQVITSGQTPLKDLTNIFLKEVYISELNLTYELHYIKIDEGWSEGNQPSILDSTFVTYKGTLLDGTLFDTAVDPVWFTLDNVVRGWSEIIPFFKSGKSELQSNGTVNYENFGNGIMIIPSAFGYYNSSVGKIPAYSPLVFNFQLKKVRYRDHDRDKILTKDELYNTVGGYRDTDADGIYDYKDVDDDGDGILTKTEITKPAGEVGPSLYYPYNPIIILDDPLTPLIDESLQSEPKGIPSCNGDFTNSQRVRKHLIKCN